MRESSQLERPILTAVYEKYEGGGAEAFPVRFRVEVAEGGQWAQFTFETVRINTGVEEAQFELRLAPGTREVSPEDLSADFLPVEEDGR